MRKATTLFIIIMFACVTAACSDGSGGNKFAGRTWSQSLSTDDQALERSIVSDVVGGIVAEVIVPEDMVLASLAPMDDVAKLSLNVPLESSYTSVVDTFSYASASGAGLLTIDVNGDFQEINGRSETNRKLRFFPVEVIFTFSNYDYTNSCGLPAVITGTISCRLQGTVNRDSDVIEAVGNCATGTKGMTGTLLYQLSAEESHDVYLQTSVRAEGPWYELTSYKFYGNYMLDRRTGAVDSVINRPPQSCVVSE